MVVRLCSKSFTLGFSSTWIKNFQIYKLGLEKVEEPEIKLPTSVGSWRKQGSSGKTSASLTTLKLLTVWTTTNCGKVFRRWKYHTTLPVSWETCIQSRSNRTGHATSDSKWFNSSVLGKEYLKAVSCHPAYLTSMQSTSCDMLGRMNHMLESRLQGEILTTSDMQMIPV